MVGERGRGGAEDRQLMEQFEGRDAASQAAPEPGQAPCALALDQCLQAFVNQCRTIERTGQLVGLGEQFFGEIDGGAHCDAGAAGGRAA
jgi:hypothetical protein